MVKQIFFLRLVALILLLAAVVLLISDSQIHSPKISLEGDLDRDGISETYSLTHGRLTVTEIQTTENSAGESPESLWVSPHNYHVDSFALGDINNDGNVNLVLSLWKRGSFGDLKPFWHTGRDIDYKNHLFIYELKNNALKQVWCSSNLDCPILAFTIRDIDGDGLNELLVTEGQYKKMWGATYAPHPNIPGVTSIRKWDEWGFRLQENLPY